jgi:hypothetical protein
LTLRARAGAAVGSALIVLPAVAGCDAVSEMSGGPLRYVGEGKVGASMVAPAEAPKRWWSTWGDILVCSPEPVVIGSVEASWEVEPANFRPFIRVVTPRDKGTHSTMFLRRGSPPDFGESYADRTNLSGTISTLAGGAKIDQPCKTGLESYAELLLAVESDDRGAELERLEVTYKTEDGSEHVLTIEERELIVCGSAIKQADVCPPV